MGDIMVKKERNSNFELMRIVSILLIILCHIINFGRLYNDSVNPVLKIVFEVLMFGTIIHVNSFVILSGYFQSKSRFKLSKLIKIIIQVIFYVAVIFFAALKIGWVDQYNIVTIINSFVPSVISNYWFINVYLITYIFSDYINLFINKLTHKEFKIFLILCFVVLSLVPYVTGFKILRNDGYSFINFIFLYMIGAYLRKYPIKDSYHFKRMSINGYRLFMIGLFVFMFILNYLFNNYAGQINGMSNLFSEIASRILNSKFTYATPFVIIQTIAYFEIFNTFKFKNRIINFISSSVIGVYLFHENPIIRDNIYKLLHLTNEYIVGYSDLYLVFVGVVLIFTLGTAFEWIRIIIEKLVIKIPIIKKLVTKVKKFFNSFNLKINW